jgi:hypothetical protein
MTPIGERQPWGSRYSGAIPGSAVVPGLSYTLEVTDAAGEQSTYPGSDASPIHVTVTEDDAPPTIEHAPVTKATASQSLRIEATVTDPVGVKWVRLRYRSVNQYQDYHTLEMTSTGEPDSYAAIVPAEQMDPRRDFMYFIEALDNAGNGCIYPDLNIRTPYIVVKLER